MRITYIPPETETGRRMRSAKGTTNVVHVPLSKDQEEWNRQVEQRKAVKKQRKMAK